MSNLFMGSNKIHISLMMLKHSQNSLCFVIITVFVCELVLFFFFLLVFFDGYVLITYQLTEADKMICYLKGCIRSSLGTLLKRETSW